MVALAELDAAELEDAQAAESPAGEPASPTTPSRRAAGQSASGLASGQSASGLASGQVPFAATFNTLMAPIDGFTDRLAGFFNGGRAR
jgi:hypothetical protein